MSLADGSSSRARRKEGALIIAVGARAATCCAALTVSEGSGHISGSSDSSDTSDTSEGKRLFCGWSYWLERSILRTLSSPSYCSSVD
jgi:hypothetical protein